MTRGRQGTRTVSAPVGMLEVFRGLFRTGPQAYWALRLGGSLTYWTFQRWWNNLTVAPSTHEAIENGWVAWCERVSLVIEDAKSGDWVGAQRRL